VVPLCRRKWLLGQACLCGPHCHMRTVQHSNLHQQRSSLLHATWHVAWRPALSHMTAGRQMSSHTDFTPSKYSSRFHFLLLPCLQRRKLNDITAMESQVTTGSCESWWVRLTPDKRPRNPRATINWLFLHGEDTDRLACGAQAIQHCCALPEQECFEHIISTH
jgi:hypothetical protein